MNTTLTSVEINRRLNEFKPRSYQLPILKALDEKFKRVLAILPRRAGKDITALNYVIRKMWEEPGVYYYIFPTYAQAKKVIWDSITNDGKRMLDYFPKELVTQLNGQEMKIRMKNKDGTESLFQLIGSDNYDCFDDETEILTVDGWKYFKDVSKKDKVATLNQTSHQFEWQYPVKTMKYDFDGELFAIKNSGVDFRVTPNHRFYVKSIKNIYKFKEISDPTIKWDMVPSQCQWKGEDRDKILGYDSLTFLSFLGLFLSEGCTFSNHKCYRVTISQIKPSVRTEIKRILKEMDLNYCETKDGFNVENKKLYEYCSQFGLCDQKFIPKDILNLSKKHLHLLFEYLIIGDGHRCKGYSAYYSTSKRLIDDVQEIVIKLGFSGNIRVKPQKPSKIKGRVINSKRTLYQITVRFSKFKRMTGAGRKKYIHTVPYKGKVYCVSVPNQIIKVRRNGFEMWSGNSLMGTNPRGCVFSEYALQDPLAYQYLRPILTANQGWALFISTPRGKNHLWQLAELAKQSPEWFYIQLSIDDTEHIPLEEIEKERREGLMSEDMIQQEYYCSFEMGVEGSIYAKYLEKMRLNGRIGDVPVEAGFKVHTAWDIGRDMTSIIFFQTIGQTVRIVDCYEKTGENMEFFARVLDSKNYLYGKHFFPHDMRVKEWAGSNYTRLEKARQLGLKGTIVDNISIEDGIEIVRNSLSKISINKSTCHPLIDALENYRREYDSKHKVYKLNPLHDKFSHMADCLRYLCLGLPKTRDGLSAEDLEARYQQARHGNQANLPPIFRDGAHAIG